MVDEDTKKFNLSPLLPCKELLWDALDTNNFYFILFYFSNFIWILFFFSFLFFWTMKRHMIFQSHEMSHDVTS